MIIRRPVSEARVLSSSDYEGGELVTHSQNCIWTVGSSAMGEALNKGLKVHNLFGASMMGMDYDDFNKRLKDKFKPCVNSRQSSKIGNFGFPGMAGPVRLVQQQRGQKPDTPCPLGPTSVKDETTGEMVRGYRGLRLCVLMDDAPTCGERANGEPGKTFAWNGEPITPTCTHCIECAVRLRNSWHRQWPEMRKYFAWVTDAHEHGMVITAEILERWPWLQPFYRAGQRTNPGQVLLHVVGVLRGGLTAPSLANGMFQSGLAVAAKLAHRIATRECYDNTVRVPDMLFWNSKRSQFVGGPSPLLGSRLSAFFHDELFGDHPRSVGHEAATRNGEIMEATLRWVCPDVAPAAKVEPCLMDYWNKSAEAVVHRGRLVPWTREHDKKTCQECAAETARNAVRPC